MSDLKTRFDEAVNYIQNAEGDFKPSNDCLLYTHDAADKQHSI